MSTKQSKFDINHAKVNGDGESREPSESPEEDAAFETLDFRNGARETMSGTSMVVTTAVSRAPYKDYDNELRNTDSNVTLYSCNSGVTVRRYTLFFIQDAFLSISY